MVDPVVCKFFLKERLPSYSNEERNANFSEKLFSYEIPAPTKCMFASKKSFFSDWLYAFKHKNETTKKEYLFFIFFYFKTLITSYLSNHNYKNKLFDIGRA